MAPPDVFGAKKYLINASSTGGGRLIQKKNFIHNVMHLITVMLGEFSHTAGTAPPTRGESFGTVSNCHGASDRY